MAEAAAWPSIQRHGLLSTSALLDLYEVTEAERSRSNATRRPDFIPSPMSDTAGCSSATRDR